MPPSLLNIVTALLALAATAATARPLSAPAGGQTPDPDDSRLTRLTLCDCAPSPTPSGLACAREGDVVVGFEREGQWVAGGGGSVPLSRATCCRVCLEEEGESGAPPLAVISSNCGSAPGGGGGMACPASTGGFISGFASSSTVPTLGPGISFPLGPPTCCTPALLWESGSLTGTQPCDCAPAPHGGVSCGNGSDGRAVRGFAGFRVSLGGDAVPAGPAQCCRACVDSREATGGDAGDALPRDCRQQQPGGGCGPHGACVRGGCLCEPGWAGPGCGARDGSAGGGGGALIEAVLAVAGAVALLSVGAAVTRGVVEAGRDLLTAVRAAGSEAAGEGDEGEPLTEPLIVRLAGGGGGAGSVGSVDTDGEEEGEEGEEGGGEGVEAAVGEGEEEAEGQDGGGATTPTTAEAALPPSPSPAKDEGAAPPSTSTPGLPPTVGSCVVCTARPIQAVAVPCGHACLCRRCARRLARCPVCRCEMVRRQRLFVGG